MKYELEKKENGLFIANVSLSAEEWDKEINNAYEKNKGKYAVAGFRKGHAPRNVIEKNYGVGVFYNDALDQVYYQAYTTVLRENEQVRPIDAPALDIKKLDETGLEFSLQISCVPEFELAQYKGLTFTKQTVEVSEEQIKEEIEHELLRASRLVETTNPVKNDDFVTLDFDGYIDGKQFEGGSAKDYQIKIGSHTFIDNFEDQLVGLNIGDKKDVQVNFPADYHVADLAGKPATFKVEIKNIRERIMPELDEEFVSNSTEFETVDEYKASVKEKLLKQAQEHADIELDNDMLDKVIDDTNVTVPEAMVENETNRQLQGMEAQMKYQGIDLEMYAKYIGKTVEELKADVKLQATRNVKARLVLEKLIKTENLDITEKDIDNKLSEMAKNVGKSLEEYKKQVNDSMINQIANDLLMKKIVEFLHANNEIK